MYALVGKEWGTVPGTVLYSELWESSESREGSQSANRGFRTVRLRWNWYGWEFKPVHFPCLSSGNATVLRAIVFVYNLGFFELP